MTPTGRLFMVCSSGGNSGNSGGTLISMRKDGSDFKIEKSFSYAEQSLYGNSPLANGSPLYKNGKIFFTTSSGGGEAAYGTILSYDTLTSVVTKLHTFDSFSVQPTTQLQVANNKLIGMNASGFYSIDEDGSNFQQSNRTPITFLSRFSYDPLSDKVFYVSSGGAFKNTYLTSGKLAGDVTNIHSFGNVPGGYNPAGIINTGNGLLYGILKNGGTNGGGILFKMNYDGTNFSLLKEFSGNDGQSPAGQLLFATDKRIYGICTKSGNNGSSDSMLIYRINTNGTDYIVLKIFNTVINGPLIPELTEGIGGELFGMTGDFNEPMNIFKLKKDGTGYIVLKTLASNGSERFNPSKHGLLSYNGYIYGATSRGGNGFRDGVLFRLKEDGTQFSLIKKFVEGNADGWYPEAGLTLGPDNKIYGTTWDYTGGKMFSLDPSDLSYKVLYNFIPETEGYLSVSKINWATDGKFYINRLNGLFSINPDGTHKNFIPFTNYTISTSSFVSYFSEIPSPITTQLCPPAATTILKSDIPGTSYQWQLNTGNGFENISNNANYSGTNTDSLQLIAIPSSWTGYEYRCLADDGTSNIYKIKFANNWTGSVSTAWENAANWSCGTIPDANTDVVVSSGTIVLNSNVSVRSLKINPAVNFTVNNGFVLTVTH